MAWTANDIPRLDGLTALVTGANSGLGFESTRALARAGAHVIMACRNPAKAEAAADRVRAETEGASLELLELDLMRLDSVKEAAGEVLGKHGRLDILLNNAGIMAMPYQLTEDGFESQFGTNHLAHFALTGRLLPLLIGTPGARVVSVSSFLHLLGAIRFHDLPWERGYNKWLAYGMSKIANLMFSYELARRCSERGLSLVSAAAHPGYASTNLELRPSETAGNKLKRALVGFYNPLVAQPAAMGALPQLFAATAPGVRAGDYYGPRLLQLWGAPKKVGSNGRSRDAGTLRRLWEVSTELTGVEFAELKVVRKAPARSARPALA
ncbi:MAG TPA: oxidoreductase [Polyangiales bacterium]|nr:oxidoreductase [Polyangiales bacterium]